MYLLITFKILEKFKIEAVPTLLLKLLKIIINNK